MLLFMYLIVFSVIQVVFFLTIIKLAVAILVIIHQQTTQSLWLDGETILQKEITGYYVIHGVAHGAKVDI